MQIKVYENFDDIPLTRDQWNALSAQSPTNTIFQTHEWTRTWWDTFGDNHRFLCLAMTEGNRITGLVPLMSGTSDGNDLHFVADANSDYCDFSTTGNVYANLDATLRFFANDYIHWNTLSLRNIPEQSMTLASLVTLCEKYGLFLQISDRISAPEIVFDTSHDDYRLKYSVRRHCNRLEKLGKVEFKIMQDINELPKMLAVLYRQHIARYHEKGESSLFTNPLSRNFYETLATELFDTGWLHFSQLSLNEIPIAIHYGFEYNQVLTWYKPSFNITYKHFSPGTVLITHLIDYAREKKLRSLDFTIGDEDFKSRFSNATTYNRNLVIYRTRPSAYLHALRDRTIRTAKRVVSIFERPHVPGKRHHPHS